MAALMCVVPQTMVGQTGALQVLSPCPVGIIAHKGEISGKGKYSSSRPYTQVATGHGWSGTGGCVGSTCFPLCEDSVPGGVQGGELGDLLKYAWPSCLLIQPLQVDIDDWICRPVWRPELAEWQCRERVGLGEVG